MLHFISCWELLNGVNLLFSYSGPAQKLRKSIYEGKFAATEEELERKVFMAPVPKKRGATIDKLMEESKEPKSF
jgi:hypothetical protein